MDGAVFGQLAHFHDEVPDTSEVIGLSSWGIVSQRHVVLHGLQSIVKDLITCRFPFFFA